MGGADQMAEDPDNKVTSAEGKRNEWGSDLISKNSALVAVLAILGLIAFFPFVVALVAKLGWHWPRLEHEQATPSFYTWNQRSGMSDPRNVYLMFRDQMHK